MCIEHGVVKKGEALVCPIDANGRFTDEVPEFVGRGVSEGIINEIDKDGEGSVDKWEFMR